jgi:hypothetical protein
MNIHLKRIILSGIISLAVNLALLVDSASRNPQAFELSTKDQILGGLLAPAGMFAEWIVPGHINPTQIVVMFVFSFAFYLVIIFAIAEIWACIRKEKT